MYQNNYSSMILELNASDGRGIDVVRDQIKEFAGTKKLFRSYHLHCDKLSSVIFSVMISSGIKLIILDEADSMTQDAQAALRRGRSNYCFISMSLFHFASITPSPPIFKWPNYISCSLWYYKYADDGVLITLWAYNKYSRSVFNLSWNLLFIIWLQL